MNGRKKLRHKIKPEKMAGFLPGIITTAALCFGLLSMGISSQIAASGASGNTSDLMWRAGAFIGVAMVLDLLDGKVARAFGVDSRFGVIYDSLSDTVCFGVAPVVLVYSVFGISFENPVFNLGLLVYAVCAALRLARFNIQSLSAERKSFMGLPSPMAAGVMISPILVVSELNIVPSTDVMGAFYAVAAPLTGFFMVSNIRYRRMGLLSPGRLGGGKKFDFLVTASVLMAVVVISPGVSVAVVSVLYLVSPFLFFLLSRFGFYSRWMKNSERSSGSTDGEKEDGI